MSLYMETTQIPAEKTAHEIEALLVKSGAVGVVKEYSADRRIAALTFSPYGEIGDKLWVRETWARDECNCPSSCTNPAHLFYRADFWERNQGFCWRPSIHMPRWASRITLVIRDIRVERVQDIREADAIAEGLMRLTKDGGRTWKYGIPDGDGMPGEDDVGWHWRDWSADPIKAYRRLWDSINAKRGFGLGSESVGVGRGVRKGGVVMAGPTDIEWADATWNPVTGCTKVSAGCKHCYAETMAERFWGERNFADVRCHPERLEQPLRWRKPKRIFVNSMSDLFHEAVPFDFVAAVYGVAAACQQHTFLVLTKRPERAMEFYQWIQRGDLRTAIEVRGCTLAAAKVLRERFADHVGPGARGEIPWPLPNVWLGVSVEDQASADRRIPPLLQCPSAIRFLSVEPLLGEVDIGMSTATCDCCSRWPSRWVRLHRPVGPDLPHLVHRPDCVADTGIYRAASNRHGALSVETPSGKLGIKPAEFDCFPKLDWVIVGGESGRNARPCNVDWIRDVVCQCRAADVPVFIKQLGAWPYDPSWHGDGTPEGSRMRLNDPKGGDMSEWPADLRVREFPEVQSCI